MTECVHHWLINETNKGTCKKCHVTKRFKPRYFNGFEWISYGPEEEIPAVKKRLPMHRFPHGGAGTFPLIRAEEGK